MSDQSGSGLDPATLGQVINVSGTMTALGASVMVPEAIAAMQEIAPVFMPMHNLQKLASRRIAQSTGAQAGFVTACTSAGVSVSVAAAMTGSDPGLAEALPRTDGLQTGIVIQAGHLCNYGASIKQAICLTGAVPLVVGQATQTLNHQLEHALTHASTVAALYVVSHHVVSYGQIPFARFVELCHQHNIPVIVDAASEYDLTGFIGQGADIVVYSGHKFLGGPTSGIVCGTRALVQAAYLQNIGIGRGMKAGKESIWGVMAALAAWQKCDHAAIRKKQAAILLTWQQALDGTDGIDVRIVPDPTNNPLSRLNVTVDAARFGASAYALAGALADGSPPIIVRDHEIEHGVLQLDPCSVRPDEAEVVAQRLREAISPEHRKTLTEPDPDRWRNSAIAPYLKPDCL